jgi:hypothetical protein
MNFSTVLNRPAFPSRTKHASEIEITLRSSLRAAGSRNVCRSHSEDTPTILSRATTKLLNETRREFIELPFLYCRGVPAFFEHDFHRTA